jgi:RNA polymerase sigma factor (sigma-70 family)
MTIDSLIAETGSDRDLARAAKDGDAAALGLLFERHRPRLYAHALQLLGLPPDAQDAVQDTFVIAIRRIGGLKDPGAVEGWLHTVLRSTCFSRLRRARDIAVAEFDDEPPAPVDETPEAVIDSLVLRDWVWTAIGRLSEPLRVAMMLRHFSSASSYDDIAAVCAVPVGTVRSRLSEGRRRLNEELLRTAHTTHTGATAHQEAEHRRIDGSLDDFRRTGHFDSYLSAVTDDIVIDRRDFAFSGRERLGEYMLSDAADGVGFETTAVVAVPGLTIVEARFLSPAHDPYHCPPATTQVHFRAHDLTHRMVWYYTPWPDAPADAEAAAA